MVSSSIMSSVSLLLASRPCTTTAPMNSVCFFAPAAERPSARSQKCSILNRHGSGRHRRHGRLALSASRSTVMLPDGDSSPPRRAVLPEEAPVAVAVAVNLPLRDNSASDDEDAEILNRLNEGEVAGGGSSDDDETRGYSPEESCPYEAPPSVGSGDEHADAGAGSGGGAPAPAAKKAEDPFYTSRFAGVCRDSRSPRWRALIDVDGKKVFIGTFFEEAEAARAVDAARRERGRADVNFPQPGTNEVLAGRKRSESGFKGVFKHGPRESLGYFNTPKEAAEAWDDAARLLGKTAVNFPKFPGEATATAKKQQVLKGAPRAANTPPIAAAASFEAAAVAGVVGDVAAGALTATIRRTSSSSAIKRSSGGRKVKVALPPMASSTADSPPPAAPEGAVAPAFDQEAVQQQVSDLLMEDGGLTFSDPRVTAVTVSISALAPHNAALARELAEKVSNACKLEELLAQL